MLSLIESPEQMKDTLAMFDVLVSTVRRTILAN